MYRLIRKNDLGGEVVYPLRPGSNRIGRQKDNDVVLDEPSVSKHHAVIVVDGLDVRVIDKQSTNGVYVNDKKVEEAGVKAGDEILLGEYRLRLGKAKFDPGKTDKTFIGNI